MDEVRVAIIGGGFGMSAHLPAFTSIPGVRVVAVADGGSGRASVFAKRGIEYSPTWETALGFQRLDAVSIAAPPILHRQIVLAALKRGLHVFCEKPFGSSVADAEVMLREARAGGLIGAVNFQFRFEPGIEAMRELLVGGAIGHLSGIDLSWLTAGRIKSEHSWCWQHDAASGGGVVGAFFSHVADLFCWFVGQDVQTVFGQTRVLVPNRTDSQGMDHIVTAEDFVSAEMKFTNGVVTTCCVSNCKPGGTGMSIEVRGDRGRLVYCSQPPYQPENCRLQLLLDGELPRVLSVGDASSETCHDSRVRAVARCAECFIRKVKGKAEEFLPSFEDGHRAHRLMRALRQSARTGAGIQLNS